MSKSKVALFAACVAAALLAQAPKSPVIPSGGDVWRDRDWQNRHRHEQLLQLRAVQR